MKRPRFSLRTVFVLIALLSSPSGWAGHQFNWIRLRHEYLKRYESLEAALHWQNPPAKQPPHKAPWHLSLFGETPTHGLFIPEVDQYEDAKRLFPEYHLPDKPDMSFGPRKATNGQ